VLRERVRLGIGPIGWANDDIREWGGHRSGQEIMREISEAGYEGTEMSYTFPQDPQALKKALADHELVLAGAYCWVNLANPELHAAEMARARAHLDFCSRAGAEVANFAEGTGSLHWDRRGTRPEVQPLDRQGWDLLLRGLDELGACGRERGLRVCFHPHAGTPVETQEEIARVLEGTDPELVSWCPDTGHLAYAGLDPVEAFDRWATRIGYVHLKDVRPAVLARVRQEKPGFLQAVRWNVFATPGQGKLDFPGVLKVLESSGYRGWLILEAEQDPAEHEPRALARQTRHYIETILGALAEVS
jgi:inosose dehydratase